MTPRRTAEDGWKEEADDWRASADRLRSERDNALERLQNHGSWCEDAGENAALRRMLQDMRKDCDKLSKRLDHAYETIDTFARERDEAKAVVDAARAYMRASNAPGTDLDCQYYDLQNAIRVYDKR